jgi:hypothetical protein
MSFSFRNLFAQDKSVEANDLAGAGMAPGASAEPPPSGGGKTNPFSSAPFSNVFSGGEAQAAPPQPAQLPKGPAFQPTPLPTNRGSFEALFAGQGIDPKFQSGLATIKARYSVREIWPFLPPALVSPDRLPMDRTIEVAVPASGSGEVKLSAIQAACPELFAAEITPLNDSEVTLPHSGSAPGAAAGSARGFPGVTPAMVPAREAAFAAAPSGGSVNPFAAAPTPTVVAAAAAAASARNAPSAPIGNPFSASPSEVAAPAPSAKVPAFAFPEPAGVSSPFGAFGSPPTPVSAGPEMAVAPNSGPFAPSVPGFAPANVSLFGGEPTPRPESRVETEVVKPAATPIPAPAKEPASGSDFPWQAKLGHFDGGGGSLPEFDAPLPKPEQVPAPSPAAPADVNPFGPSNIFGATPGEPNPFGWTSPTPGAGPVAEKKPEPASPGFGSFFDQPVDSEKQSSGLGGFDFSKLWGPPQEKPVEKPVSEFKPIATPAADSGAKAPAGSGPEWPDFSSSGAGASSFFDQENGGAFAGEPFDFSSPWQSSGAAPKPAPSAPAPKMAELEKSVVFSLGEILRPIAKVAGINLASIPPAAKVWLPISLIEPQLSRGTVSVTISQLIAHADAPGILGQVNRDLTVPLPQNELFHQLSELAPELVADSDEDLESQFSTLFGTEAMHDASLSWNDTPFGRPQKEAAKPETMASVPNAEKPVKKAPVDLAGHASAKPAASPAFTDPFAPLPRRTNSPAVAMSKEPADLTPKAPQVEDLDTSFFDDLNEFSASVSANSAANEPSGELEEEIEVEAETELDYADEPESAPQVVVVPAAAKATKSAAAFPVDSGKAWAVAEKASLDDLEQVPAPLARTAPKAPKISISVQRNSEPVKKEPAAKPAEPATKPAEPAVAPVVAVVPKGEQTGFFEELGATVGSGAVTEPKTTAPTAPTAAPVAPAQPGGEQGLRDIELRAVFGTNEPFTYLRVADLTASLPGITAAAIVAPGFTAQSPRNREAGELAIQASTLILGVREIARISGMPNAETFTLHTDQGVLSIFLHGDFCLTVRHTTGQFDPGVREKLILVARGLAGLSA